MALGEHVVELLEQRVELRRRVAGVALLVDERGVEREHAQERQRPVDDEPLPVEVVEEPEQLLPFALQHRVVQAPVLRRELDGEHLLLLRRQLGRHELLRAAQDQGADASPQALASLGVAVLLDRPPVPLVERPPRREQPRRHELQDRPQLAQVVLDRRARDREAERRTDAARRLVHLRRRVLHELRLVEHESTPLDRGECGGLEAEHRIGGDDEVGGCRGIRDAPAALGLGRGDGGDPQARGEPLRLVHPVRRDRRGRDDEERSARFGRTIGRGVGGVGRRGSVGGSAAASVDCCSTVCAISASVCAVLPRPMSSARTPPSRFAQRNANHRNPASWYGRNGSATPAGCGRSSTRPSSRPATRRRHSTAGSATSARSSKSAQRLVCERWMRRPVSHSASVPASSMSSRSGANTGWLSIR